MVINRKTDFGIQAVCKDDWKLFSKELFFSLSVIFHEIFIIYNFRIFVLKAKGHTPVTTYPNRPYTFQMDLTIESDNSVVATA